MPHTRPTNDGGKTFQVNPDDLLTTYPNFYAASDDIRDAATNLSNAVIKAISAFDGDTQKKLQTLGNSCVTNLKALSGALGEIASHLQQSANATSSVEHDNMHMF